MKINEKNKASKNSSIDDRHISKDFSEIFDTSEDFEDIGTLFIDARVKKGLTQEDVSKTLKVRISAVKQIERGEELKSLGTAYSLGLLRSYAKLVDLQPDEIIKNYKSSNEKNEKFDYNFPGVIKEKRSLIPFIGLFTFLFTLVIYSTWYYLNINNLEIENKNISYVDTNNNNLDYVKIESKEKNLIDDNGMMNSKKLVSAKQDTSEIITNNISKNTNVSENTNLISKNEEEFQKSIDNVKKEEFQKSIDNVKNSEISAIANERIPKEEMVLKSSGNSWVEIEDLDGNSYLTRLMRSGETFVVPSKKGLTLSTGNAGVLSLTFGSIHIPKLGGIGEVISSRPLNIEAFKERWFKLLISHGN